DYIGESLGSTIAAALPHLQRIEAPTLRVRRATVPVPLQDVTLEEIARARPLVLDARAGKKVEFFDLVKAYKALVLDHLRHTTPHAQTTEFINWGLTRTWAGVGDRLPVEVHVFALGEDVAIVCLPGEIFVDL